MLWERKAAYWKNVGCFDDGEGAVIPGQDWAVAKERSSSDAFAMHHTKLAGEAPSLSWASIRRCHHAKLVTPNDTAHRDKIPASEGLATKTSGTGSSPPGETLRRSETSFVPIVDERDLVFLNLQDVARARSHIASARAT